MSNTIERDTSTTALPAECPCLRCGYDLRGLPDDGGCPECGLPVARSAVPSEELRHAPAGWLASLAWGTRIVCFVMVFVIVWRFLAPLVLPPSFVWHEATLAPFGVAFAAGVWLLSRPQPRFGPPGVGWRWALRLAALSPLLQTAVSYHAYVVGGRVPHVDLDMLTLVPLPVLLLLHLRRLALRVLSPSLAEHCAIVGVGGSASLAAMTALMFRMPVLVEVLASVGTMLFYLWAVVLLVRFAVAFGRAHRASVADWGGGA